MKRSWHYIEREKGSINPSLSLVPTKILNIWIKLTETFQTRQWAEQQQVDSVMPGGLEVSPCQALPTCLAHKNYEIIYRGCHLKPLCFGVIYYAAINNQNNDRALGVIFSSLDELFLYPPGRTLNCFFKAIHTNLYKAGGLSWQESLKTSKWQISSHALWANYYINR